LLKRQSKNLKPLLIQGHRIAILLVCHGKKKQAGWTVKLIPRTLPSAIREAMLPGCAPPK